MLKVFILVLVAIPLLLLVEIFIATRGKKEVFKNPERKYRVFGNAGATHKYIILGDSTSAGQGAPYEEGIAVQTAKHLSTLNKVNMLNLSISGATTEDIIKYQLAAAVKEQPDVVLISAGANDVTHFVTLKSVEKNIRTIIDTLIQSNCNVKVVLTASPDLGGAPRLPQPLRWLAGLQASRINTVFYKVIQEKQLTLAPIYIKTGPIFRKNPKLFAEDRYHPNEKGYKLFVDVINKAFDTAINEQTHHCVN